MADLSFNATITIGHHHMTAVGLDPRYSAAMAVDAVRRAVESLPGANWIDVAASDYPASCPGWVIVYPGGSCLTPDMPVWHARLRQVEDMAKSALVAAAVPF